MQYIIKKYSNRQIRLGLVASCKKGNKYGILYGYYVPLVFFEKETSFEIPELTLVSYLPCEDSRCPKGEYVFPVDSLVIHRDMRSQKREDDVFHDDEAWRLITEGVPYFDYACQHNYSVPADVPATSVPADVLPPAVVSDFLLVPADVPPPAVVSDLQSDTVYYKDL